MKIYYIPRSLTCQQVAHVAEMVRPVGTLVAVSHIAVASLTPQECEEIEQTTAVYLFCVMAQAYGQAQNILSGALARLS